MRIILVDDDKISLKVLEMTMQKIQGIEVIGRFIDSQEALNAVEGLGVDAIFLDMEMNPIGGLAFAKELLIRKHDIEIVFVTAHSEYALEAFEVSAVDYLLKPVRLERLKKTIASLEKRIRAKEKEEKIKKKEEETAQGAKSEGGSYIHSFGSFRLLDVNKKDIKWRTKKVKELFAYLWHHREQPCHKMRIIEDLWPDMDLDKATTLFHTTLYSLRKTINKMGWEKPIVLQGEKYFLNFPTESDWEKFESLLESTEINESQVKEILRLYEGDYFEEENYEWILYDQQKIKESLFYYLEQYVMDLWVFSENQKAYPILGHCLEKMLELDPYNEQWAGSLMTYYINANDKGKFIHFYESFKTRIEEELGLDLSKDVMGIYKKYISKMG